MGMGIEDYQRRGEKVILLRQPDSSRKVQVAKDSLAEAGYVKADEHRREVLREVMQLIDKNTRLDDFGHPIADVHYLKQAIEKEMQEKDE